MGFWFENMLDEPNHNKHVLIDLGLPEDPITEKTFKELKKYIGQENLEIGGGVVAHVLYRIPKRKVDKILRLFPEFREDAPHIVWCTHGVFRKTPEQKKEDNSMKPVIRKLVKKVALEIDPDVEVKVVKIGADKDSMKAGVREP